MDTLPDIISKDPEDVTDDEFKLLIMTIGTTRQFLEILQKAHKRLTGGRMK